MTDIALKMFMADGGTVPVFDISLSGGELASDGGLSSSVLLSLFLNRRANAEDRLPAGTTDRGGWWPEAFDDSGIIFGSRLWLLYNRSVTSDVLRDFQAYAEEALAWLIKAGIATRVSAVATRINLYTVSLQVEITQAKGGDWSQTWSVTLNEA